MFPAVVIDLGTQVAPTETAWVLDACNAAIVAGSCELDQAASEPARAVAIVRWVGSERRTVRIEVGLREADRAAWSVRELDFSTRDPLRERWRSVGFVLATLVGEVSAAQSKTEALPAPAEPPAGAPPAPATAAPAEPDERKAPEALQTREALPAQPPPPQQSPAAPAPAPVRVPPSAVPSAADADAQPPVPLTRPRVFLAGGVLAGQGATFNPLRWGAGVRGGWISPAGWVLSASGDVSRLDLEQRALDAQWLRVGAGPGYRFWLSERWSLELGLELGVRGLRIEPNADGSLRSTAWSALGAGHLDGWWQAFTAGGAWAGLTLSSIGRETHLLDRERQPAVVVPVAELHAMLGFWWAP